MRKITEKTLPDVEPGAKEKEVLATLEVELLNQAVKAVGSHKYIEAYVLLWTSIEQFMLPTLMGFIARNLKLTLPPRLSELPISHVTRLYYFISHDKELFLEIEKIRKSRNKLIHKMYVEKDWKSVKNKFKSGVKDMVITIEMLKDRLSGKKPIPSLQIYRRGWIDALEGLKKKLDL